MSSKRIANMTKKHLVGVAWYSWYDGFDFQGEFSEMVWFKGNVLPIKETFVNVTDIFTLTRSNRVMFVPESNIPTFIEPPNSVLNGGFFSKWYVYDWTEAQWLKVEFEKSFIYTQRGLKHIEYRVVNSDSTLFDEQGNTLNSNGAPIVNEGSVEDFENVVLELSLITPLILGTFS